MPRPSPSDQVPDAPPSGAIPLPAPTASLARLQKYLGFRPVLWLLLGLVLLRAAMLWSGLPEKMTRADNDDLLRMVMVRDWLAGQSWFDTQQYRLLPPEGISIHWSRYIDAGIGGIIMLASTIVSVPLAEQVALLLWPTLLLALLLVLNGIGTRQSLGPVAGAGAMLCVFLWTKLAEFEFAPGRLDHHNVQILASTALIFALIWPCRSKRGQVLAGAAGAVAAALSLAVGLEMLPVILTIWGLAGLRFVFGAEGSGRWLLSFALTLGLAAPLMMAGQVPVSAWAIRYCDALALPLLSLLATGVAVSLVPALPTRWLRGPASRFGAMCLILGAGLWLASPLLGPCLAGPYGAMSPEARNIILTMINEAQPALSVFVKRGENFDFALLYAFVLLPVVTFQALRARKRSGAAERFAVLVMLVIGWLGVLGALAQLRAITLGAPAIPFLTGFALRELLGPARDFPKRGPALAIVAGIALMAVPVQVMQPLRALATPGKAAPMNTQDQGSTPSDPAIPAAGQSGGYCRDRASLAELEALPPSLLATSTNMGMSVLYFTHHSATAAPYHRSGDAFWNGVAPFGNEADMRRMLRKSGADYVILCRKQSYSAPRLGFARQLVAGEGPDWLEPVDLTGTDAQSAFLVLRVVRPLPDGDLQSDETPVGDTP